MVVKLLTGFPACFVFCRVAKYGNTSSIQYLFIYIYIIPSIYHALNNLKKKQVGLYMHMDQTFVGILKRTIQRNHRFLQQVAKTQVILQVLRGFEDIPTDSTLKYTRFLGMPLPPLIHGVFSGGRGW